MLRLRKTEQQIAGELGIGAEETRAGIDEVRHCLGREGMLYLIEDPEMVSLHGQKPDDPCVQLPSNALGMEDRMVVREFIRNLRECFLLLPPHQNALLRLRYRNELTASEIADFATRTGTGLFPGKPSGEVTEQDVYYGLKITLGMILEQLKMRYRGNLEMEIGHLKSILEEFEV